MNPVPLTSLVPIIPELILALGAMALLMLGAYRENSTSIVNFGAVVLLIAAAFALVMVPNGTLFGGSFIVDDFARFLKILTYIGSAFAIIMSLDYMAIEKQEKFEFSVLIVLSTVGMGMLISAGDLIALYLGLETMSLALYVVAASARDNVRSTEAGLKYFVLGALSSGMLLYGCSLIYGFTGNISFAGIAKASGEGGIGLVFGLVFLFAGFCFKVSAVPFHMWTPDVYEGSPTPITAFFATAPKVAAMALIARLMWGAFGNVPGDWGQIIAVMAVLSMFLGSIAGIGQRDIKRLMAYSSIGHMGYALVGLAAADEAGVTGVMIYMATYMAMTLGTFGVILSMRRKDGMVENVDDLAGLSRTHPMMALAMLPPPMKAMRGSGAFIFAQGFVQSASA